MNANIRARWMIAAAIAAPIGLASLGCDNRGTGNGTPPPTPARTDTTAPRPADKPVAPDNTGRNAADRGTTAPTPMDQGENATDRRITADIRKAIMGETGMSTNAQNCKVITKDGVVTLRGPVETQAEKDTIESKARAVAGVTSVVNELEVKPK
jgi:hyperosmotically inducible periplasmic protein